MTAHVTADIIDRKGNTMVTTAQPVAVPKGALWTGRILSGLVIAFLTMDGVIKFFPLDAIRESSIELGLPLHIVPYLGGLMLIATALYAWPRTSVLGAILLTGYLGGAICTHLRVGHPLFTHTLFGVYLGLFIWGGLFLRDPRLRAIFPWRRD